MPGIYENLKKLRVVKKLTQEDVAQKIGLTRQAISSYESGRTQPGIELLMRFSEIYEVDLEEILYGPSKTQKESRVLKIAVIMQTAFWWLIHLVYDGWMAVLHIAMYPPAQEQLQVYFRLREMLESFIAIGLVLNFAGCTVLLVMDLGARSYISWKKKLCVFSVYTAGAAAIAYALTLVDPVCGTWDGLAPAVSGTVIAVIFLLVDILIVELRRKKRRDIG